MLGGGFGGIAVAVGLRDLIGDEHHITLVDRQPAFSMGLRKLWELAGLGTIVEGSRPRSALVGGGIEVVEAEITAIDPARRSLETSVGHLQGERLVVALGAQSRPHLVPGLAPHGHDVWSFRTAPLLRRALETSAAVTWPSSSSGRRTRARPHLTNVRCCSTITCVNQGCARGRTCRW